jgi:hypothetical protein
MDRPVPDEPTTRVDRAATNGALIAVGSPISEKTLATRAAAASRMLQPSSGPLHLGQPFAPSQEPGEEPAPWGGGR